MIEDLSFKKLKPVIIVLIVFICLSGIVMRFYRITKMDFVFYDEGYYLNFSRYFYERLILQYPDNFKDMTMFIWYWLKLSLATGKALWFLMSDARVFFGAYHFWPFPRVLAAIAGTLSLGLVYLFAKRLYRSKAIGILSVVLLAIMPSHVFYSRLGMQETFSTLCFLSGFYFYLFPRKLSWRTFLAGVFFAGAWFTNYRLITLPAHIAFCELILSVSEKRWPDLRKYIWCVLTFFFFIFMVGNLDNGNNTVIVFAWIFYQSNLAKEQFDLFNFFSFPYYLFRLENFFFGLLFFANIYHLVKKQWIRALPFGLAFLHMFIYSFAGEKGARYLCVVSPFLVMAVASLIVYLGKDAKQKFVRVGIGIISLLLVVGFYIKSVKITKSRSGYQKVAEYLLAKDRNVKFIATQNYVFSLFTKRWQDVAPFPYKFRKFMSLYGQGYRYLVIGPQAYVSFVRDMKRFDTELFDFIEFVYAKIKPIAEFDHFDDVMLERFVFDHNENLKRSLNFLKTNDGSYGKLRVFDIAHILGWLDRAIGLKNIKLNPEYKPHHPFEKYGR